MKFLKRLATLLNILRKPRVDRERMQNKMNAQMLLAMNRKERRDFYNRHGIMLPGSQKPIQRHG